MKKKDKDLLYVGEHIFFNYDNNSGVVVVPVSGDEPVLIFKLFYKGPFMIGLSSRQEGFEKVMRNNHYDVYWKERLYYLDLPDVVHKEYGDFFKKVIEEGLPTFLENDLPEGCFEFKMKDLIDEKAPIKISDYKYLKIIRKIFRGLGLLKEVRGRRNESTPRKKAIIEAFEKHKSEYEKTKRFPIVKIRREINKKYNYSPQYECSDSYINKILRTHTK